MMANPNMTGFLVLCVILSIVLLGARDTASLYLPDSMELRQLLSQYEEESTNSATHNRTRRAIRWSDREEILQLHNKLRGGVYPTASDMEYMVWDDELELSATHWAQQCHWDHGPQDLLMTIGQNLAVHFGRYRSPADHVQSWYNEVRDYTYPYAHECDPRCPERCSGPVCTHYTQVVWATTSRVGCAVHLCPRMDVWGEIWENAVYLVCNYSPKGNWYGEAPYQYGRPCSQCPPSYGGECRNNLCYKGHQRSATQDMNEVEKPQIPVAPRAARPKPSAPKKPSSKPSSPKADTPRRTPSSTVVNTLLAQNIKCETRLRDKCRGATCNRYNCPANCLHDRAKVWGTLFYDVQSSICRAAIHFGVINNNGGLVDIKRMDRFPFFIRTTQNGIESLSKSKPGNAFGMSKVEEKSVDCYTTVAEICAFKHPSSHCPRVYCPTNCKNQPSYWSPVVGNNVYADHSSICKAAIHAGVIKADGGFVDVLPLPKRESFVGVFKNGILSESKSITEGGSFRLFAVRK